MSGPETGAFSKYRLIAELGHGGMAEVYLAMATGPAGFNKLVVIKQIRDQLAEDPEFLAMFLDEARLAARLNHPNVVATNEVGQEGNQYFIAMEYLEGQPLSRIAQRLERDGHPLSMVQYVRVLIEALGGLHYAHDLLDFDGKRLEVVHRDATPHNVFVTYSGQVKVVDFGIAKALGSSTETRNGVLKGKVAYMAPEQAKGERVDRRADIFAAGMMLWEGLAGRRPFRGVNDVAILQKIVTDQIPSPRAVRPEIPEVLEAICLKAIAHDRERRYATALEMQRALEDALESLGERPQLRDVGELAARAFDSERMRIKLLVEAEIAGVRADPPSRRSPLISEPPVSEAGAMLSGPPSRRRLPSFPELKSEPPHTPEPSPTTSLTSHTTAAELVPAASTRGRIAIAVLSGALVAGSAVAAITWPRAAPHAAAARPAARTLHVESTPPGATVSENGKPLGATPLAIALDPAQSSPRELVLSLDGFSAYTFQQGPAPDDVRVVVPLTPAPAPPSALPPPPPSASSPGKLDLGPIARLHAPRPFAPAPSVAPAPAPAKPTATGLEINLKR